MKQYVHEVRESGRVGLGSGAHFPLDGRLGTDRSWEQAREIARRNGWYGFLITRGKSLADCPTIADKFHITETGRLNTALTPEQERS